MHLCIWCMPNVLSYIWLIYGTLYTHVCVCYISYSNSVILFSPLQMKNPRLALINKVEIKTKHNVHFLKEGFPNIPSYSEHFFRFTFSRERAILWVGFGIDSRKCIYSLKTILCILPFFPFKTKTWIFVMRTSKYR